MMRLTIALLSFALVSPLLAQSDSTNNIRAQIVERLRVLHPSTRILKRIGLSRECIKEISRVGKAKIFVSQYVDYIAPSTFSAADNAPRQVKEPYLDSSLNQLGDDDACLTAFFSVPSGDYWIIDIGRSSSNGYRAKNKYGSTYIRCFLRVIGQQVLLEKYKLVTYN
ncbi:MAG: hypothetical protein JST45_01245 [Bacteroidetes bacterium]|nr:hypothetical protein [Bacteroidota bacterium]